VTPRDGKFYALAIAFALLSVVAIVISATQGPGIELGLVSTGAVLSGVGAALMAASKEVVR